MIFAIDGAEFGAFSSDVASLQTALVALGRKVGDATLAALVVDGLIGPKTTAAANVAMRQYVSGASAALASGTLSQVQVASSANTLATAVAAEVSRRGGTVATVVKPAAAALTPTAVSDNSARIVKYAALGLGGVIVASVLYYFWRWRQGKSAFGAVESLHARIARALGWSIAETQTMSLQSLRELVRPVDARLASEISEEIQSGRYLLPSRLGDFGNRINDHERELWVNNNEGLYRWYQQESRRMRGGMKAFLRRNRAEIDAVIRGVRDRQPG